MWVGAGPGPGAAAPDGSPEHSGLCTWVKHRQEQQGIISRMPASALPPSGWVCGEVRGPHSQPGASPSTLGDQGDSEPGMGLP